MRERAEAKLEKLRALRLDLDRQIKEAADELAATDAPEPQSSMTGILDYLKSQKERRASIAKERVEQSDLARQLKAALAAKKAQDEDAEKAKKAKKGDAESA